MNTLAMASGSLYRDENDGEFIIIIDDDNEQTHRAMRFVMTLSSHTSSMWRGVNVINEFFRRLA